MSSRLSAPSDFAERPASTEAVVASAMDEERVVLRDGSSVVIRPLAAGDEATIDKWFAGLGPETRYERFLTSLKLLDPQTRSRLASVDHRDHEAITAVASDGTIVAIARYVRAPKSLTAEVAVAVVDRWTGRGLASLLLERIAERSRAAGIRTLTAWCLASNAAIIRLLRRLGPATMDPPSAGVVKVRIDLAGAGRDPG